MTDRAERTLAQCSLAVRRISSTSWCRRVIHAVAATTTIGIAVIAGCSDDDDTAASTTDGEVSGSGNDDTAGSAPETTRQVLDETDAEASPADLDAQLACDLLERWGGAQSVEERGIDAVHLGVAAAAAGQAAATADDRYEALGEASSRLAGNPGSGGDGSGGVVGVTEDVPPLLETDAFVSACTEVGYEIDEDVAQDEAAAPEIVEMACERAARWNDAWTADEIEIKDGIVRGWEQLSRRMAVARAGIAAGTYDERFAGLKDAGETLVLGGDTSGGVTPFDRDGFQDAIDALQQECEALPSD